MTPDITCACFSALTAWRLWELAKKGTMTNIVWAGLAMGLMLLSKFTALLLVPIFFATDITFRSMTGQLNWRSRPNIWRELRHWVLLASMALLIIFAAYGFNLGGFALSSGTWLTLPAAPYFQGAFFQFTQSQIPHSSFLMGMHSFKGYWYYYLVVCALKLPIPLLVLLAGLVLCRRRPGIVWRADDLYLLLPFGLFFVYLSLCNTIQNGFRYLLPVYPLLLVWLGHYGLWLRQSLAKRTTLALLALWLVAGTLAVWPNYLAYFNELAGGWRNGYHWLADSNVDWGQSLKQLKQYMATHGIARVQFAYFGTADPAHYQINYDYLPSPLTPLKPPPVENETNKPARFVALSAFQYQGNAFTDNNCYAKYFQYEPNQVIGGSILLFDLENLRPRTSAPVALKFRKIVGLSDRSAPPYSCP